MFRASKHQRTLSSKLEEEFCMNRAQVKSSNSCKNDDIGHAEYLFDENFPAVRNIESKRSKFFSIIIMRNKILPLLFALVQGDFLDLVLPSTCP